MKAVLMNPEYDLIDFGQMFCGLNTTTPCATQQSVETEDFYTVFFNGFADAKRGLATMCVGVGQGSALLLERV